MVDPPATAADPLAGATIVVHDLSRLEGAPRGTAGVGASDAPSTAPAAPTILSSRLAGIARYGLVAVSFTLFGVFGAITYQGRPPAQVTLGALVAAPKVEIRVHVEGAVLQPGVYRLAQGDRVEEAIKAAGGLAPNADDTRLNLAQRLRDEQRLDVPALPSVALNVAARDGALGGIAPSSEQPAAPSGSAPDGTPSPGASGQTAPGTAPSQSAPARPTGTPRPQATARPTATARAQPTARATTFSGGKINVNTATQAQLEQLPGFGATSAQRILAYRTTNGPLRSLDDVRKAGVQEQFVRQAAEFLAFD